MEKEELKQRCLDAIDANRDLIIQLGDDVYKTPELGYKEFKTTERMIKAFFRRDSNKINRSTKFLHHSGS